MLKKIAIIIMASTILITISACNHNELDEYSGENIRFNYPANWEPEINEYFNMKTIILNQGQDEFDFVIEIEKIDKTLTGEEWSAEIKVELDDLFIEIAEEMVSIEIVQTSNPEIDGFPAQDVKRKISVLDSQIERLYLILAEGLQEVEEVNNYLLEYEKRDEFISAIKEDHTELHELQEIIAYLKGRNGQRNQNLMLADNFIDNIIMLEEDNEYSSDELFYDYAIKSGADNYRINIYYQAYENEFFDNFETIEEVIDSIEIK